MYKVSFIFNDTIISTLAESGSSVVEAKTIIYKDLGYSELSSFLESAQGVIIEPTEGE